VIGWLEHSFASGGIALWLLALVACEWLLLSWWSARRGNGGTPLRWLLMLLPGAWLMAAVGTSLAGLDWRATATCLAGALVSHLCDLRARLR